MDLCSVTQGDEPRKISFLSTALGVIADLDLGTSPLLSGAVCLRSLADQSWSSTTSRDRTPPLDGRSSLHVRVSVSSERVNSDKFPLLTLRSSNASDFCEEVRMAVLSFPDLTCSTDLIPFLFLVAQRSRNLTGQGPSRCSS